MGIEDAKSLYTADWTGNGNTNADGTTTSDIHIGRTTDSDPDEDGACPECGDPADNSRGVGGGCDHPCHDFL